MEDWQIQDSINDVAEQMIEEDRVSEIVDALQQAYPALLEISHACNIPREHIGSFSALLALASHMDDLVLAQMRTFYDPRY